MSRSRNALLASALFMLPFFAPLAACGGGNAASAIVHPPDYAPKDQTKCGVKSSQADPLVVEWPPAERGRLEASIHTGIVAVHYEGCEMKLLPYCKVKDSSYKYTALTRKEDSVHITNEDDLYASLPAGALALEGKLKEAGQLNVQMTLVGRWDSGRGPIPRTELDGDCDDATHVVTAVTVGAFTFFAGGDAQVGASVGAFGAGAGGSSASKRETLTQDGDPAACTKSSSKDPEPPDDCGALLRIEVVPIKQVEVASVEPPPTSTVVPPVPTASETSSSEPPPLPSATDNAVSPPPSATSEPPPTPTPRHPWVPPPAATSTNDNTSTSTSGGTSGTTESGPATRGTIGTVVGWSAALAFGGGAILGAMGYAAAQSVVGDQASGNHCLKDYGFCDSEGMATKSRAHVEALIGDGLMAVGLGLGITYFFLPLKTQSTSTQVGVGPGSVQLKGTF